jgi:hypothetical protein
VDYNPNYSYHYDPDTIDFFEYAMEVCDATFDYTEEYLDEAGGAFLPGLRLCPWSSELLEEVSLTPTTTYLLGQLRRGTLGTGTPVVHQAGAYVQDIGPSETIPYTENTIVEQVVSDGTGIIDLIKITPTRSDNRITWFTNFGYRLMSEFFNTEFYNVNDVVVYNNTYYKCIKNVTWDRKETLINENKLPDNTIYWEQYISVPANYGESNDVEVFVGGYSVNSEWASNVLYNVGAIITIGSYTYRCSTSHTSTKTFHADMANWEFFVGNIRLKKSPYRVHNVNIHSESPEGDVLLDPEFSVSGFFKQVRLTTPVAFGTQVTVIKRTLTPWDGNYNTINIRLDDNKIAGFLRATPGIWYSSISKDD